MSEEVKTPLVGSGGDKLNTDKLSVDRLTKLKDAGKITAAAMIRVRSLLLPGANVHDLCVAGDASIREATKKVYSKVERGIAFPTCVSPNNIVSNFAPLSNTVYKLREGDLVKVEMGTHIDGHPAVSAQTFVVNTLGETIDDKRANVLIAANVAAKCILNSVKPGMKWADVKRIVDLVALEFDCFSIADIQFAELGRFKLYAASNGGRDDKSSPLAPSGEGMSSQGIWSFNIAMSTCNGNDGESETKPTIYEKVPDVRYGLKMKASRQVFSEITKLSLGFPFNVGSLISPVSKETKETKTSRDLEPALVGEEVGDSPLSASTRIGLKECFDHGLINNFRILEVEENEFVARIRFTIVMQNGVPVCLGNEPTMDHPHVGRKKGIESEVIRKMLSCPSKSGKPKKSKSGKKTKASVASASGVKSDKGDEKSSDKGNKGDEKSDLPAL